MWISKERWNALNTRIADLERRVQSQQTILLPYISINYDGEISSEVISNELKKAIHSL